VTIRGVDREHIKPPPDPTPGRFAQKGRLVQYTGRILRPHADKSAAEVHDYHDELTGVLASSLAKRAPGYTRIGFPDPREHLHVQRRKAVLTYEQMTTTPPRSATFRKRSYWL
jgi:superfamily II DNA or RNA helicase